jgi:hypothetical protein
MAFITTLGLIAGGLSSAQQFISGASASRRAKQGLEEFEFQNLSVGAFDTFSPSLAAEQQQLETVERQRARVADVAAGLGASEAMALLSQTDQQLSQTEQQAFARQEQLMAQADVMRGQDFQQRRAMEEQRSMAELQSLQQEMAAGQQMMASGLGGISQLAVSAGLARERMLLDPPPPPPPPPVTSSTRSLSSNVPTTSQSGIKREPLRITTSGGNASDLLNRLR